MILLPSTRQRIARVPFLFRAHDCLDATGLFALSYGQKVYATFTRTGLATALDARGHLVRVAGGQPRVQFVWDGTRYVPALLLEGTRENKVVQSDTTTAAAGWSVDGTISTAAGPGPLAGRLFTRIAGFVGQGGVARAVTLTGDGVKAFSILVRANGANTGTAYCGIYDATDTVYICRVTITIGAGGVVTAAAVTGALTGAVEPLGDGVYRIHAQSIAATAAHAHTVVPVVDAGGATLDSLHVSGVQVEDAPVASSLIPTTTAAATRADETCRFPYRGAPRAGVLYVRGVEQMQPNTAEASPRGVLTLSDNAVDPRVLLYRESTALGYRLVHDSGPINAVAADVGAAVVRGDLVELLGLVGADGAPTLTLRRNTGSPEVAGPGAAAGFGVAWSTPEVFLNSTGVSNRGQFAVTHAAIGGPELTRDAIADLCEVG